VTAPEVGADAYLLDVREPEEWSAGHAPGAHHVPMMEIPVRLDEVPTDADVVVVCRSGGRSSQVVAYLASRGWDNVRNLDGGMGAWVDAGREIVRDDGQSPRVL
jgi:rhodanese-related sulfurtransferase